MHTPQLPCHQNTVPTIQWTSNHEQLGELAIFIDAIPAEFREEILLAAFHLHPNAQFSSGYLVDYVRLLLQSCFVERTGNKKSRVSLQGIDLPSVLQALSPIATAEDPAHVALALNGLMNLMAYVSAMSAETCVN